MLLKLGEEERGNAQSHHCGRGMEDFSGEAALDMLAHQKGSTESWPNDALAFRSC